MVNLIPAIITTSIDHTPTHALGSIATAISSVLVRFASSTIFSSPSAPVLINTSSIYSRQLLGTKSISAIYIQLSSIRLTLAVYATFAAHSQSSSTKLAYSIQTPSSVINLPAAIIFTNTGYISLINPLPRITYTSASLVDP